ncbi:MAG: response regulator [Panacagrimonas sp.]
MAPPSQLADQDRLDLVLLDYHLPDANGLAVLTRLRQRLERSVIILLSAEDDPAIGRSAQVRSGS